MLQSPTFTLLPLGSIKPRGWLQNQLRVQADGLTGHLDEFWPSVADSRWIGGSSEGWERGPYWLDGLIPLAFLLDDEKLKAKAQHWVDFILAGQHDDGWLGAKDDSHEGSGEHHLDPWPLFVLFKAFLQWHEATRDERIVPALVKCARRIGQVLRERALYSWARVRWADLVLSLHRLHELSGDEELLEIAALAHEQGYPWREHFEDFKYTAKTDFEALGLHGHEAPLPLHGVNNAMGLKSGPVWWRQSGDEGDKAAGFTAIDELDKWHGQVTGMFSGDEHIAGRSPVQGTETCTVVEYLFSLEQMLALTGEVALGDRIERIAFNALPAAMTKDMWGRQYDQQPNQVLCSVARRDWVSNGADSNLFSLEGNFGCCTANLHQGWPKLASSAWLRPHDGGLALAILIPCEVTAPVEADGQKTAHWVVETNYPFAETFTLRLAEVSESGAHFPLHVRIPAWAQGATATVGGQTQPVQAGTWATFERDWWPGDEVTLHLPMPLRLENRGATVALLSGPLVMALRIGEEWREVKRHEKEPRAVDWEVHPTSPWNYALAETDWNAVALERHAPGTLPFSSEAPPVTARVPARRVPGWTMKNDSAAPPPADVGADGEAATVELIPYGCTGLRISEFPLGQ